MQYMKKLNRAMLSGLCCVLLAGCAGAEDIDSQTQGSPAQVELAQTSGTAQGDAPRGARRHEGKGKGRMIERFDQNGDGVLQLSEVPEHKREKLSAADTNKDGALSKEELQAFHQAHEGECDGECEHGKRHGKGKGDGKRFDPAKFDANKDGKIQVSELPERAKKWLADADTNQDGVLSPEEMDAHRKDMGAKMFAKADSNGDGVLTQDEVGERRWSHMAVADANQDGKLTADELRQAHESGKLRPPHRGHRHDGPRPDEG